MYISMCNLKKKRAVGAHCIRVGLKCTHARPTQGERKDVHTFASLNSRQGGEVTALDGNLYADSPREPQ